MEIDFPRIAVRLAVLIVLVGIWFVSRRRARRQVVVLGAEAAEAAARESLHRQQFADVPPPLPRWQYPRGAQALIDPQVLDLDRELRSICASLAESSPEARQDFRNAATADDFYALLTFAKRASVFALRVRDEAWVRDALTAVALVDAARVDGRDVSSALGLVHHAAGRLGQQPPTLFAAAAALAAPATSELIEGFARRRRSDKDLAAWGQQEIQSPNGPGFVAVGFRPYKPTRDLLAVALAIREAIERDRYDADVELADELAAVWFPKEARTQAETILARSVATVRVTGDLHPSAHEEANAQRLSFCVVEMRSEEDAATLHQLAGSGEPAEPTIAAHRERLFALAVHSSIVHGIALSETKESIRRFEAPLLAALERGLANRPTTP